MSATLDILANPAILGEAQQSTFQQEGVSPVARAPGHVESYAEEQVRGLVRQVFLSGAPFAARQIVFSGIEKGTDISRICLRVAENLAGQVPGRVCLVNADLHATATAELGEAEKTAAADREYRGQKWKLMRKNLWLVSVRELMKENGTPICPSRVGSLLAEIRCEFQYAVIQGPPAVMYNEAALLGQICNGIVLVVHAQQTRRIMAHKVKNLLLAANIRLLGTVLDQREFPIPERIYRRL